ncbi:Family of serine hydrolases 3 [Basidiobolus ranarum]|uniref:Family of serine hydrolases 3 n=1 Tax=Basidiobolus ranarum TaxID=34480 RepID=A0ABR2WX58_9FUNG
MQRILCLHGFTQNGEFLSATSRVFQQAIKPLAELVFLDAPHKIEASADPRNKGEARAWWRATGDGAKYEGYESSLKLVRKVLETNGPFDGILGFSQGACFTSLIVKDIQNNPLNQVRLRYAITCGGFVSRCPDLITLPNSLDIPSLHLIGDRDKIMRHERTKQLADCFVNSQVLNHPGGHSLPSDANTIAKCVEFIKRNGLPDAHF